MKTKEPKFLITYLCEKCKMDITRPETHSLLQCSYCEASKENLKVIKTERFTKAKLFENLEKCVNRMYNSLEKAFEARPKDGSFNLETFIDATQKAKDLKKKLKN